VELEGLPIANLIVEWINYPLNQEAELLCQGHMDDQIEFTIPAKLGIDPFEGGEIVAFDEFAH
jgi:hypothetical protein